MRHIDLDGDPPGDFPYSQGVAEGGFLFVAGQLAADEPGTVEELGNREGLGDIAVETRIALARIGRVLAAAGCGFGDVVRVGVFMTDLGQFGAMNDVYRSVFPPGPLPARTCVGVASLLEGALIEIDCVARLPPST